MKFCRLNDIHMKNFGMGSVNVADQLRMKYRPDLWMHNSKWWWSIFLLVIGGAEKMHTSYSKTIILDNIDKMYRVQNEMSHLQLLKYLSTHLMTFKKRKSQQLRNTSAVFVASVKKVSNYIPLHSFDSRIYHQRRAGLLDVRATPISKNTLATNFSLILYG